MLDGSRLEIPRTQAGMSRDTAQNLRAKLIPRVPPRVLGPMVRLFGAKRFVNWSFGHYLRIAHPDFAALEAPKAERERVAA